MRKYSWSAPDEQMEYLKLYITDAEEFSRQIKNRYGGGLTKKNVEEFKTFTDSNYTNLEDLLTRALESGELNQDKYNEIMGVLGSGRKKCVEKAEIVCSR